MSESCKLTVEAVSIEEPDRPELLEWKWLTVDAVSTDDVVSEVELESRSEESALGRAGENSSEEKKGEGHKYEVN